MLHQTQRMMLWLLDGSSDCFDGDQAAKIRMIEMYEAVCTKDGSNPWDIRTCL